MSIHYNNSSTIGAPTFGGVYFGEQNPPVVTGEAILYGDSELVVAGVVIRVASSSISGDSILTVTGVATIFNDGSFSGDTVVTAVADRIAVGRASIGGESSITATGSIIQAGYAEISGQSVVTIGDVVVSYSDIEKQVMYKIFNKDGMLITTWNPRRDVISSPTLKEQINNAGTEFVLTLARPADNFGEGADVNHENRIELWVADKDAPNGVCMFIGRVSKYKPNYNNETVDVTVLGYGSQLSMNIIEGAGTPATTTVAFNSYDPGEILMELIDKLAAMDIPLTYTVDSIDLPGTVVSYTFNTNTYLDGFNKVLELCPQNWYYYIDQSVYPHVVHLHERADTPDHVFTIGQHITNLDIEKSVETIVNRIFFTGGDTGSGLLYKRYDNLTSQATYGVRSIKVSDGRVTQETTADIIAGRLMVGNPQILVNLGIGDNGIERYKGYNIEAVNIGDMVKIGNTGASASSKYDLAIFDTSPYDYDLGNIGTIQFQITERTYTLEQVTMSLSTTPPDVTKRIADIKRNLEDVVFGANPATPDI